MATKKTKSKPKARTKIMAAIHEMVSDMHEVGIVDAPTMHHFDKRTMRGFDESSLTPVTPLSAQAIRSLRLEAKVSQTLLARYLNVAESLVSQWERGEKKPSGPSLKLLSLAKSKGIESII